MRISDWSSDVCSSDLPPVHKLQVANARPEDSGRGIAHLPRALMAQRERAEGGVIEIVGKRSTPARAVYPYPEDEGMENSSEERRVGKECDSTCRSRC